MSNVQLINSLQQMIDAAEKRMAEMCGMQLYKKREGFTQEDIYTLCGRDDAVSTITLNPESEGYSTFGEDVTISFVYTPSALFEAIGNVDVVIHSKDTEASKEGTDVSSQYTNKAVGHFYNAISDGEFSYYGKVLTTRSNGNIYVDTKNKRYGDYSIWADKASSNHDKYRK